MAQSAREKDMNRTDFMNQLESLLQSISSTEREEAMQYYNDYFDDAGAENEQEVIEALGNPARVAENIKRDLLGSGEGSAWGRRAKASDRALAEYEGENGSQGKGSTVITSTSKGKTEMPVWIIVLIAVLLVCASPALVGIVAGLAGGLIGIVAGWFGMIFGFGSAALALFVALFVLIVVGCMCIAWDPLVGVALMGGGLICGGLGILFMMLTVAMGGIATPAICKWVAGLFRKKSEKKEK